jgi:hypothetical protein
MQLGDNDVRPHRLQSDIASAGNQPRSCKASAARCQAHACLGPQTPALLGSTCLVILLLQVRAKIDYEIKTVIDERVVLQKPVYETSSMTGDAMTITSLSGRELNQDASRAKNAA